MQTNRQLDLRVVPGAPASAIPRTWFLFVNNVLRYLKVKNGRLDVRGDRWTIICDKQIGWSGYWWFGGQENGPYDLNEIEGKYFGCNLKTGAVDFSDEPFNPLNIEEWEWRYVADKEIINAGTEDEEVIYTLSSRTSGDIVFRIV
jgi:hypothetical protein